jgi:predicted Rossmann fold nucleotide-binding protein DprA/Smf involved in DNA uptake
MSAKAGQRVEITVISQGDERYPFALRNFFGKAPGSISTIGNSELLNAPALALFCSVRCPGALILKTYDLAQKLREGDATVISGFHSPIERECLNVLLKSSNNLIICPARGLESMRMPLEYRKPLEEARMLLVSPFTEKQRQASAEVAERRNLFVAALASQVFVSYAAPHSKTERLCRRIIDWKKPLFTFGGESNSNLTAIGAGVLEIDFSPLAPTLPSDRKPTS